MIKAASHFCKDQLGTEVTKKQNIKNIKDGALLAYIDITMEDTRKYRIYLRAEKEFVQLVAKIFLEEETSSEETMRDMMMECANLIVGSAKVIASKNGIAFSISTPHIKEKMPDDDQPEESALLQCSGKTLAIAIKKINKVTE